MINQATDFEIAALVGRMAEINGNSFIRPSAIYSPALRECGWQLVQALGANQDQAMSLRDDEMTAFYSVARKSPGSGRQLVRKRFKMADEPQPKHTPQYTPQAPILSPDELEKITQNIIDRAHYTASTAIDEKFGHLPDIVAAELARIAPRKLIIQNDQKQIKIEVDHAHAKLPDIVKMLSAKIWPMLVGPAGSGKTTLCEQAAKALGVPFYFAAKVDTKGELLGYILPGTGEVTRTSFREAYEHGGMFLLDEADGSNANALNAFNAAFDNGFCPFPDKIVMRSPDFYTAMATNTFGQGPDRQYVGRNQLDAAFLNRFAVVDINYDEQLETALAGNQDWCKYVQAVRKYIMDNKIRALCTPRATIKGSVLIETGFTWQAAAHSLIFAALSSDLQDQIKAAVPIDQFETSIL